ncbi:MAG: APC family permease [Chloroflexi bacterium]|nr:APC family permease [Chloroflexota bacterium]
MATSSGGGGDRKEGHGLEWREVHQGAHPGDRFVRLARHRAFRKLGAGRYEIRASGLGRPSGLTGLYTRLKHVVIGEPLATAAAGHERLTKLKALAVLSSDALSSVAYATEEIMRVLLLAGTAALTTSLPIGGVLVVLLFVVGFSYRQTIKAYPTGGGSYIVAKDNLGTLPGLAAAGSLLTSYTLTVAVSVAAGVKALASAYPSLDSIGTEIGVAVVIVITLINLRGIRESGSIFMLPTYVFLGCMVALLGWGLFRFGFGPTGNPAAIQEATEPLTLFLMLRAFASGGAALTGVEAISDGVPAFQKPEWINAQKTLTAMVVILAITFSGITYLANRIAIVPGVAEGGHEAETVVSQIAHGVFGDSVMYYAVQYSTFLILFLAANTAYSDFPRLAYFLGRDRFLPHQFTFRGDRLAYSVGIVVLGIASSVVLWMFGGSISRLIPLYAFGVFSAFTLSQAGMVMRWWRRREPGWQRSIIFNGIGAVATFVVLLVVAVTKFADGAWMVVVLLPMLIILFRGIHAHYTQAATELAAETPIDPDEISHQVVVPIAALNQVALQTLAYARSIARGADDVVNAVHITDDPDEAETLRLQWEEWQCGVQLTIIESPFRSLVGPLLAYIDAMHAQHPGKTLTVVLPEMVPAHWWEQVLHNQTALRLKAALLFRPGIVVADVPYHLKRHPALAARSDQSVDNRRSRFSQNGTAEPKRPPRKPRVIKHM